MASFPPETRRWAEDSARRVLWAAYFRQNPKKLEDLLKDVPQTETPVPDPETGEPLLHPATGEPVKLKGPSPLHIDKLVAALDARVIPDEIRMDQALLAEVMSDQLLYPYSFEQPMTTGVYAELPNEGVQANCSSWAGKNFAVAQALGLNPTLHEFGHFRKDYGPFASAHNFITFPVGEEEWTVDQAMRLLGPIEWTTIKDGDTVIQRGCIVHNRLKGVDEIGKEEKKTQAFTFLYHDALSEEVYMERLRYLRSPEGAASMLVNGQRIGLPKVDRWKTKEPVRVGWYVRFKPRRRSVSILVDLERPLIQNRGLEYRFQLDEEGAVKEEIVTGYFFQAHGFAEFVGAMPLVQFPAAQLVPLLKDLDNLSVDLQCELEESLMELFTPGVTAPEEVAHYRQPILDSYQCVLNLRPKALRQVSLVEALYQAEKKNQQGEAKEFMYREGDRMNALKHWRGHEPAVDAVVKAMKIAKHIKSQEGILRESMKGRQLQFRGRRVYVLDNRHVESEEVQQYLDPERRAERIAKLLEIKARFFDECLDRRLYIRRKIEPNRANLEGYARSVLGDDLDTALMRGYARIATEFLGHFAHTWKQLTIPEFRANLLKNVGAYLKSENTF